MIRCAAASATTRRITPRRFAPTAQAGRFGADRRRRRFLISSWGNSSSAAAIATAKRDAAPPSSEDPPTLPSPSSVSGATTHFGYADVPVWEKETKVREVFESVADSYDVMNDLMSAGLHRLWKDELVSMSGVGAMSKAIRRRASADARAGSRSDYGTATAERPPPLLSILDVAGGTGDVAFRFVDAAGCPERSLSSGRDEVSVTVCDINAEMLRVGERRARERYGGGGRSMLDNEETAPLRFVKGNAQCLPFEDGSFDLYTISFGLRNVTDVDMALGDALRVLKPGGRFLCLEFSKVTNPVLGVLYNAYSFNAIPTIGELVTQDRDSYQYLVESIRKFFDQDELKNRMEAAGFQNVTYTNMTGGVVAVHSGWKPLA